MVQTGKLRRLHRRDQTGAAFRLFPRRGRAVPGNYAESAETQAERVIAEEFRRLGRTLTDLARRWHQNDPEKLASAARRNHTDAEGDCRLAVSGDTEQRSRPAPNPETRQDTRE